MHTTIGAACRTARISRLLGASCSGALLVACGALGLQTGPQSALPPPAGSASAAAAASRADGYYTLGRNQYAALRYGEAKASYQRALQLDPRHLNARNGLAVLHAGQGEYAQAIALWQELVAEEGSDAAADRAFLLGNLGYAYFLAGQREQAETALAKACLLDPLNPLGWEHLGMLFDAAGQGERAAAMFRQVVALRAHDVRDDAALLPAAGIQPGAAIARAMSAAATAGAMQGEGGDAWPHTMPRTEIVQLGAALVQVWRVQAGAAEPKPAVADAAPIPGTVPAPPPARLEISNGNGVTGMAARLSRSLKEEGVPTVRLSNLKPFAEPLSRIEYQREQLAAATALAQRLGLPLMAQGQHCKFAELRIVLGHDALKRDGGGVLPQRYLK